MYKLYLKIASRYLFKNKLYSFINIFGLTAGIASFMLIMLYVNHEHSYDKFEGSDRVYRVYMDYLEGGKYVPGDANAYIVSGPTLKEQFPEIEEFARLRRIGEVVLLHDDEIFDHNTASLADPTYFDVFDRSLEKGDVTNALNEPYSIVLSTTLAKKIFGDANPLGKTLKIAGSGDLLFTVTGTMNNKGYNTHLKNDFLVSFKTFYTWEKFKQDWDYTWNQNAYFTYIKVDKNADIAQLGQKIMDYAPEGLKNERHLIEPIEDIHLYSNKPYEAETNGNGNNVRFLAIIAFITLLLCWMNYMNLSSSKSLERAKEVGIRKVVGAKKPQLALQFLLESALLNIIAIILAVLCVYLLLPSFNALVEQDLGLDKAQLISLLPYLAIMLIGASLAAFYPAFVLTRFKPTKALKGKAQTSSGGTFFIKALVVCQFVATIALLIGTFVANKQIHFLKNRPIGATLDPVIALKGQVLNKTSDSLFNMSFDAFEDELRKNPYIAEVTGAGTYPGDSFDNLNSNMGITFPNGKFDEKHIWYNYSAGAEYFDVMGMEFVAGGPFVQTSQKSSNNVVINEKMAHFMEVTDVESIVGKTINYWGADWTVAGVIKDYNHSGMKSPVVPMVIRHRRNAQNVLVKLDPKAMTMGNTEKALDDISRTWHQIFPVSTYNYTFLDQKYEALFKDEQKFAKAFQLFTVLAILIASLGLFGLTSYTCLQRTKEIGIRKVNGATITQILSLLNKDFVKWIGLAFVIAVPIAWYAMDKWLSVFAYKTPLSWWVFALAGILALMIALLTVSWQSIKAAMINPVESLRNE